MLAVVIKHLLGLCMMLPVGAVVLLSFEFDSTRGAGCGHCGQCTEPLSLTSM